MRQVVWSETARAEYLKIIGYVAEQNVDGARRIAAAVDQAIERLAERNSGRLGRVEGTFEKSIVGLPYVLAYAENVTSDGVERLVILRVIHTSRNWPPGSWPAP